MAILHRVTKSSVIDPTNSYPTLRTNQAQATRRGISSKLNHTPLLPYQVPVPNLLWNSHPRLIATAGSIISGTGYPLKPSERVPSFDEPKGSLKDLMASVSVKKILERKKKQTVCALAPEERVSKAINAMTHNNCGSVLVAKPQGRDASQLSLLGIFTERDYLRRITVEEQTLPKTRKLGDVMTPNPICVTPRHTLADCARLMVTHHLRNLPVLENDNDYSSKIYAVLSSRDVIRELLELVETCEDVQFSGTVSEVFDKVARTSSVGIFVESEQQVLKALEAMVKNKGAVLATKGTHLVGIFTERDFVKKIVYPNKCVQETTVGEVMTPNVVCVHSHTNIKEALNIFLEKKIRFLPIVNLAAGEIMEERLPMGMIDCQNVIKFITKFSSKTQPE